jgi:hypothetical protein
MGTFLVFQETGTRLKRVSWEWGLSPFSRTEMGTVPYTARLP